MRAKQYRNTRSGEVVELVSQKMDGVILRRTTGQRSAFCEAHSTFEQHYQAVGEKR